MLIITMLVPTDVRTFAYILGFTFISFNYVCWFVPVGTGACSSQKKASTSLGLELKEVVCHPVGCWKQNLGPLQQ